MILDGNVIGKKLIALRGDKTQKEVAKTIGVSVSALSMYEQGNRIPRDEVKMKLSDYYKISVESLFFEK